MLVCAREGCDVEFEPKTHNQKYHDNDCCKLATNTRVMVNYYKDRDRRNGVERWCEKCQESKLSRYNESDICSSCRQKAKIEANNSVVQMLMTASLTA